MPENDGHNSSIDLTGFVADYLVPKKRSKRAADKYSKTAGDVIDLAGSQPTTSVPDILQTIRSSYEESLNQPKTRGRKKKDEVKRLTYKQALKVIQPATASSKSKSKSPRRPPLPRKSPVKQTPVPNPAPTRSYDIDLTGEVELTDKHSSAPLFQKQAPLQIQEPDNKTKDDSDIDLDLDTIKIKVKTDRGIEIFPTREHQNFQHIFSALGSKANCPVSKILIYSGDKRISSDDTPHSINYKFSTILKMHMIKTEMRNSLSAVTSSKKDQIEIKFQWDKDKVDFRSSRNKLENSLLLKVSKIDTFKTIIGMLCEKLKIDSSRVSLSFDGDLIDKNETPEVLEFDGGETMDCKISSG